MGLNTALFTSLSGMTNHSTAISVTGNNIANVSTNGYKASRTFFESQVSFTLNGATAPTDTLGGSNPSQVGMGTRIGAIDRNFTGGTLQTTGVNTDVAVDGDGFFILGKDGRQLYTREGNFNVDRDFNLVLPSHGGLVQGYGVDDDFNVTDVLGNIQIPLGNLTLAEQTTTVRLGGNLNAGGELGTRGALLESEPLLTGGGAIADADTLLTDLEDSGGTSLFSGGDILTVSDVKKGQSTLPPKTFQVGPDNTTASDGHGQTLDELMGFLREIFGIHEDLDPPAGVGIDGDGRLRIEGNPGTANDLTITSASMVVNKGGADPSIPLSFSKQQAADGESVRTTYVAYDSLGNELTIDLTMVLEGRDNSGTQWRYYAESEDDTDLDRVVGNGTLRFDNKGALVSDDVQSIVIHRNDTGAFFEQQIDLEFTSPDGMVSALTNTTSQLKAIWQDGSPMGTLETFDVGQDGIIWGQFSNSLKRPLGQLALATFANNRGLTDVAQGLYDVSANSGLAMVGRPGTGGAGRVLGGTLELSNVELSQEFIDLITASTGYSANSRVLSTSDRLIQELLSIVR